MPEDKKVVLRFDAEEIFPRTVVFSKASLTKVFSTKEELARWIEDEKKAWTNIIESAPDSVRHILNENLNRILKIQVGSTEDMMKKLDVAAANYFSLPHMFVDSAKRNPLLPGLAASEIIIPGSSQYNARDPLFIEAMIMATVFRAVGNTHDFIDKLNDADGARQRFESLLSFMDKNWEEKIAGFAAKVALGAPREYWSDRALKHEKLASDSRSTWNASLIAILLLFALAVVLVFATTGIIPVFDYIKDIRFEAELPVMLTFITLLSLIVWWLRQVLRDMRSHEHLSEDAAERVTMIETYAAMKGHGLGEGDLSLILSALYRPASTGLIHDDGPAVPLESVARILRKP
jgi:hypothetical protein